VSFCDLHSAIVAADIARSSRRKWRPCVMHGSLILSADFLGQLNHAHKKVNRLCQSSDVPFSQC